MKIKSGKYLKKQLSYFESQSKAFEKLLWKLVSFETYSGDKIKINKFLDFLEKLFSEFNPHISRIATPEGDILLLSFFGENNHPIALLSHVDTVKVSQEPIEIRQEGNTFYANGCYDMKSAIALFYFVMKAIQKFKLKLDRQIKIIFTPDEETGSKFSKNHLLKECHHARAVILPEPPCPDGGVKTRRKGTAYLKAELTGKAVHSGIEPEKGKDANRGMTKLIERIDKILKEFPDVSFNPGIISGGQRINIVSPFSVMEGELRSFSTTMLLKAINKINSIDCLMGVKIKILSEIVHPALDFNSKNKRLYKIAEKVADSINYKLTTGSSGGGSDGSSLSAAGIPVIDGLGIKGEGAHSENEHINLSDFPYRASIILGLCQEL